MSYKTPFKESHYDIREQHLTNGSYDTTVQEFSEFEGWDETNPYEKEAMDYPRASKFLHHEKRDADRHQWLNEEDLVASMRPVIEEPWDGKAPNIGHNDHEFNQEHLEETYHPTMVEFRQRLTSGLENDKRFQNMYLELEYFIENTLVEKRRETGRAGMYKGHTKKWQVLDDDAFARDQVEKIQAAVKMPHPAELEQNAELAEASMQLPVNNANVSAWRDDPLATDSADFSARVIEMDKEEGRDFFLARYSKPKELAE